MGCQTGQELLTLRVRGGGPVAFSPDGKRLAVASSNNPSVDQLGSGEIKVWDAQTGQELLTFQGRTGDVTSVASAPTADAWLRAWQRPGQSG